MSIIGQNILAGASGAGEAYEAENSLRFNVGDTSYLGKTFAAAGNQKTWTFSCWYKQGNPGDTCYHIAQAVSTSDYAQVYIDSTDQFRVINKVESGTGSTGVLFSTPLYRDPGSWYHFCCKWDSTPATPGSDDCALFVNGVQVVDLGTADYPDQNDEGYMNGTEQMTLGFNIRESGTFDGYLAEVYFIDGQALGPESFGKTDPLTNQWVPKDASTLTFGTNGYYLKFEDSAALGNDSSGNNNDFSVTGIAATDQMIDNPTNNFCTLNSLDKHEDVDLSEGNLKIVKPANNFACCRGTFAMLSGKWYFEGRKTDDTDVCQIGVSNGFSLVQGTGDYSISISGGIGAAWDDRGYIYSTDGSGSPGVGYDEGDIVSCAFDADTGKIWWAKNGTWQFSGDPAAGTTPKFTASGYDFLAPFTLGSGGAGLIFNFGQDSSFSGTETSQGNQDGNDEGDFYYTPPTGFLTLCENNLPDPSIALPGKHFNPVIYTGTGSELAITGVGFQPDFTWIKTRALAYNNRVFDSVRGVTKELYTNTTGADVIDTESLKSFDSDGFTLGTSTGVNPSSTMVSWNWKAGGAPTVDNSAGVGATPTAGSVKINGSNLGSALAGTIAVTRLSANTTNGFSVGKYTATGSVSTLAHGLSQAPNIVIVKKMLAASGANDWTVGLDPAGTTSGIDFTDYLVLNSTGDATDDNSIWDDIAPTTSVFTVSTNNNVGTTDDEYVFYCFHNVEGYSKVGWYKGSGSSTSSPFINTGFKPTFVLIKQYNTTNNWYLQDGVRNPYNEVNKRLNPNLADAEYSGTVVSDYVSNGFKIRHTDGSQNTAGGSYLYLAFAENPFKTSNAR